MMMQMSLFHFISHFSVWTMTSRFPAVIPSCYLSSGILIKERTHSYIQKIAWKKH